MWKVKQIVRSLVVMTVIGVVATAAGLSVYSASGQTGKGLDPRMTGPDGRPVGPPPVETFVKTYYVGDIIGAAPRNERGHLEMDPVVELITSTVARGTWTINDGHTATPVQGDFGPAAGIVDGVVVTKTVGSITPFFLSISLIVRHTPEVHDEVANLLLNLRRLLETRQKMIAMWSPHVPPTGPGATPRAGDPGPTPVDAGSPLDRNARIRRLLDELRREVEALPEDRR